MSDEEETWNVSDAMNKIRAALAENNQSIEDLFASIDGDDDGQINGPELYKGLQSVVGDKLSPNQVSMIIKALDTNEDNRIDLGELSRLLRNCAGTFKRSLRQGPACSCPCPCPCLCLYLCLSRMTLA